MTKNGDGVAAELARLRAAREQVTARLDDPRTPAYSVAPLTNQLRLVDKRMNTLLKGDSKSGGLPETPADGTLVDLFRFRFWHRRISAGMQSAWPNRQPLNEYARRERAIFESWERAGFTADRVEGESVDAYVARCRAELTDLLESEETD